jgi:hypothetical protein
LLNQISFYPETVSHQEKKALLSSTSLERVLHRACGGVCDTIWRSGKPSIVPFIFFFFLMTKLTRYRHLWICFLACSTTALVANRAMATGNNFETAQAIDLNQRYEGSLPVGQGRHCYRVNVPNGKKVTIQGSNNYGTVFVSAYTGNGNLLIGETQILSSFQQTAQVQTEESDGSVMVCVDSDMVKREQEHRYSLQIAVSGATAVAQKPAKAVPVAVKPSRTKPKNPVGTLVAVSTAPETLYPQPKTRKSESTDSQASPYVNSPLQLAANSRSFDQSKDGGISGDAGNSFKTARVVSVDQMYGGYLNAKGKDDRDCYVYPDLPRGSKLKVAIANNEGIIGISAYSDRGTILIGQTYLINQQSMLQTEATSGDVMVCVDTDGEKSDHQYTFNARLEK